MGFYMRKVKTKIYYDGDCPFCHQYVRLTRLRKVAGDVSLISLRDDPEKRLKFEGMGIDVDEGMVVEQGGELLHGSEAIHRLALMTTPNGVFNKTISFVFSKRWLAIMLYPLMRALRNLALMLLGKQSFRKSDAGENALLQIFGRFFGLFSVLHVIIYLFRYTPFEWLPTSPVLFLLGFLMFLHPASVRIWVLLLAVMALDAWLQAPLSSNHTVLKNFWVLAMLLGGLYAWIRGIGFEDFFRNIRPVGQSLLLIMYFYGVFHKINSGFLDPEVSCAVDLWRAMPFFLSWLDVTWFYYVAIYGVLVIEAMIIAALLFSGTRHAGIVIGILFHGLLALSGYAMYAVFSTLTISLHVLFLTPDGALNAVKSPLWRVYDDFVKKPLLVFAVILVFAAIAFSAIMRDFSGVSYIWGVLISPLVVSIALYGSGRLHQPVIWSRWRWVNVVSLAFFVNGAMPYMGLKTAQTLNMFANLRLEGGVSNHLIMHRAPSLFHYLDDLAKVQSADPELRLDFFINRDDNLIVYYDLLNRMEKNPEAKVSFTRGSFEYRDVKFNDVKQEAEEILHSRIVRKFFHFRWVRDSDKITCDSSAPWEPPAAR